MKVDNAEVHQSFVEDSANLAGRITGQREGRDGAGGDPECRLQEFRPPKAQPRRSDGPCQHFQINPRLMVRNDQIKVIPGVLQKQVLGVAPGNSLIELSTLADRKDRLVFDRYRVNAQIGEALEEIVSREHHVEWGTFPIRAAIVMSRHASLRCGPGAGRSRANPYLLSQPSATRGHAHRVMSGGLASNVRHHTPNNPLIFMPNRVVCDFGSGSAGCDRVPECVNRRTSAEDVVRTRFGLFLTAATAIGGIGFPASAGPALLIDTSNGKVLYAEDMDELWHPASLTKIMTAYLAFREIKAGRLRLDDKVTCSEHAHQQSPSKIGLPVGSELSVELALKALIIKSANDVAVMIAEKVSGSEHQFVADMNRAARELGMSRTIFVNPNGLPAKEQVTTARDMARLARAVVQEFPEYASFWSMTDMRIGKIRLNSHNGLLKSFEGADGIKTGFICDSGFNVVASATREGRQLVAVVMGEPSGGERTIRAASLLEHGFQSYDWKQLFNSATIDNTPLAASTGPAQSVRHTIQSWSCGNGPRNPAVDSRKDKISAASKKKSREKKKSAGKKTTEN